MNTGAETQGGTPQETAASSPPLAQRRGRRTASNNRPGLAAAANAVSESDAVDDDIDDDDSDGDGDFASVPEGAPDDSRGLLAEAVAAAVQAATRDLDLHAASEDAGAAAEAGAAGDGEQKAVSLDLEAMRTLQYETIVKNIEGGSTNRVRNYMSDFRQYKVRKQK